MGSSGNKGALILEISLSHDPLDFLEKSSEQLYKFETENCLILGLLGRLQNNRNLFGHKDPNFFTISFKDNDYYAIQTPPHNILIAHPFPEELIPQLIDYLKLKKLEIPGITAEVNLARCFSQSYTNKNDKCASVEMNQKIYDLTHVNEDLLGLEGKDFRKAHESELDLITNWMFEFCKEAVPRNETLQKSDFISEQKENFRTAIKEEQFWLLTENKIPKTMARSSGGSANTRMISGVFTPREFRNNGYASICVANLSHRILKSGKKKCILFTDLSNPTSNNIYKNIGYKEVSESIMIKFS